MAADGEVYRVNSPTPVRNAARKRDSISSKPGAPASPSKRPTRSSGALTLGGGETSAGSPMITRPVVVSATPTEK